MIRTIFEWTKSNPEVMIIGGVVFLILLSLYEAYEGRKTLRKVSFEAFVLIISGITIAYFFAI